MKIRIYLSNNSEPIGFNYPHRLCGVFHQWLGSNDLHNQLSLYSLGWLNGKVKVKDGHLHFPKGAYWDIGIHNDAVAEQLIQGLLLKDFYFHGMGIRKVTRLAPPYVSEGRYRFLAGSPVLLRKKRVDGKNREHVTYQKQKESQTILERVFSKKAGEANISVNGTGNISIRFDEEYPNPKTKLIDVRGIKNRASVCPVIAKGPPEALEFLWTVGAGELTGVGFGSLDHTDPLGNDA